MAYLLRRMCRVRVPHLNSCRRDYSTPYILSEEVARAKAESKPIVALESTIITHGMPYPKNLETALQVENVIRQRGATPATIAILKGQLTVGLTEDQVEYLAKATGVIKASRRDLAYIAVAKLDGATTVAGTIIAAELADIPVFVTGGIGGVHREGEVTMDISADLTELGRCKTLVVCSGVKSILDIEKTLEYLETQGVCVCSYGDAQEFPAFYTTGSGHRAPHKAKNAQHAAGILHAAHTLRLQSGIVVAVPVPKEHAMDDAVVNEAISLALEEAKKKGIKGKEVTPFILAAVARATGGSSLESNIALIKNNAKIGADIAVEFEKLKDTGNSMENAPSIGISKSNGKCSSNFRRMLHTTCCTRIPFDFGENRSFEGGKCSEGDVLVIGGANVDRTYRLTEQRVQLDGSTHACKAEQCGGGVGRNMAEALWRLRGGRARLLTAVGDDADGHYLANIAPNLLLGGSIVKDGHTASYAAMLDARGECLVGLGDMDLHSHITVDLVNSHMSVLEQAPMVVLDGNVPDATFAHVLRVCQRLRKPVFFEPTDKRKALKHLHCKQSITFASPNLSELRAMAYFLEPNLHVIKTSIQGEILQLAKIVLLHTKYLIVTLGSEGVAILKTTDNKIVSHHYAVKPMCGVQSVSGAGDCFASGFIHGMLSGYPESACVFLGFEAARAALLCKYTIPNNFNMTNAAFQEAKYVTYTE